MGMEIPENTLHGIRDYLRKQLASGFNSQEIEVVEKQLLQYYFGLDSAAIILDRDRRFSESELLKIIYATKKLKSGEPIQYVLGETEFFCRTFLCDERALIPRPETEELCDWVISENKGKEIAILDIGTGSGCIPCTLDLELPLAFLEAWDVSEDALNLAAANAKRLQAEVLLKCVDVLTYDAETESGEWDIIVSNPPYVLSSEGHEMNANVVEHEPHVALFVDDNDPLLFYRVIARMALLKLKPGGAVYFEIHEKYGPQVVELLRSLGFVSVELREDMYGKDRLVKATVAI